MLTKKEILQGLLDEKQFQEYEYGQWTEIGEDPLYEYLSTGDFLNAELRIKPEARPCPIEMEKILTTMYRVSGKGMGITIHSYQADIINALMKIELE